MPYKRRVSKDRGEPQINAAAIDLYERARQLQRRKWSEQTERELSDVAFRLGAELKLAPYEEDPLDCITEEPPSFMRSDNEIADWHRSRAIRQMLDDALKARRDAAREAERRAKSVTSPAGEDQ
jgi:hypothetical protein